MSYIKRYKKSFKNIALLAKGFNGIPRMGSEWRDCGAIYAILGDMYTPRFTITPQGSEVVNYT